MFKTAFAVALLCVLSTGVEARTVEKRTLQQKRTFDAKSQHPFASARPAGCPTRRWCGCYMAAHLGISDRNLWVARNWARIGHAAPGPQAGAIVVWRHHVGLIKAAEGNRILVLSGNDGRAVRERWRSVRGVIAYRVAG